MKKILILNMGLKSIRSIVFDELGNKLGFASLLLTTQINEEQVMQDPKEWWDKSKQIVKESLKNLKDKRIDYISVTSSSSCLLYIDKNGEALERCIMVSDKRAQAECEYIKNCSAFKEIETKTGISMDASFMLPKILWVKNKQPALYEKVYKFISPNDYFIGKLTGEYITDSFNAQKYHFDIHNHCYPQMLLEELGIEEGMLPAVKEPGEYIGRLTLKAAEELGVNIDASVYITSYDAICSFFGSGVSQEGDASDVSGTVTAFRTLSHKDILKSSSKIFITPFQKWNINIIGGSNNLGGGLIEWVKQCYYYNEPYPYEVMEKEANEVEIGAGGLIFLPYLLGERAPIWDDSVRGAFIGLERIHTRSNMTRAVFESTGFIDRDMIAAIEETGVSVNRIKLSGGLARNLIIAQIKADITQKPIDILDDFETTAIGAAILTLISAGIFHSLEEAAEVFVNVRMIIIPNEKRGTYYDELYMLYKKSYIDLKDWFTVRKATINRIYSAQEISLENL